MDINNFDTIKINDYTLIYVNNIIKCSYIPPNKILVDGNKIKYDKPPSTYFILDTPNHVAVGHWLYESAIYISAFHSLKKIFGNIKIVLVSQKKYKNIILDYLGVSRDDIMYEIRDNNNLCFFPKIEVCLFGTKEHMKKFSNMINTFYDILNPFKYNIINKSIETIILPRHKVENYVNNDRTVDTSNIELNKNIFVYDSSNIGSIDEQIINIKKSKNIIIPDGSAFVLNGTFAMNSRIIILGFITIVQALTDNPKLKIIIKKIAQHNEIIYIINDKVTDRLLQVYTYDMVEKSIKDVNGLIKIDNNIYIDNTYNGRYDEAKMKLIIDLWQMNN